VTAIEEDVAQLEIPPLSVVAVSFNCN
jgi:hypothetical protein